MRVFLLCILFSLFFVACNDSTTNERVREDTIAVTSKDTAQKFEMKQYWMVFLKKGPNRTQDSISAAKIQEAHLRNIDRLASLGKIVLAGPMGYDKDLRGIFVIDAIDSAEAASYIKTDSAIITGRLRFELHPWWTAKGKVEFK
jgi:uncharacterized protein YciI